MREQDKVIHNILWPLTVIILYIYTKHLRYRESWNSFNTWYWEEPWFTIGPCQRFLKSFLLKHQNWTQKQARKEKAILSSIIISTFPGNLIKQILFALHFTCEKTEDQWNVMICPRLPTELGAELEGEAKTLISAQAMLRRSWLWLCFMPSSWTQNYTISHFCFKGPLSVPPVL